MNNVEKNLSEVYEKFYYPIYILELTDFLDEKIKKISEKGGNNLDNMKHDEKMEFFHFVFKEGVNYYIYSKLTAKLKEFEESVSSQPMLLAYPNNVDSKFLNYYDSKCILELLKNGVYIEENKTIYTDV